MSDRETFKEIISKAEKGGYKGHLAFLPAVHKVKDFDVWKWLWKFKNEIIFTHDFLKAFFGTEELECDRCPVHLDGTFKCYDLNCVKVPSWQYYSVHLIISEDRIKYLKGFLNEPS